MLFCSELIKDWFFNLAFCYFFQTYFFKFLTKIIRYEFLGDSTAMNSWLKLSSFLHIDFCIKSNYNFIDNEKHFFKTLLIVNCWLVILSLPEGCYLLQHGNNFILPICLVSILCDGLADWPTNHNLYSDPNLAPYTNLAQFSNFLPQLITLLILLCCGRKWSFLLWKLNND